MDRIKPYMLNYMKKLKRGPAVIVPKEAGMIISYTGVGKDSKVVEIGTGSGFLTIQLARIVKEIITYEKRKEFAEIAEENFKKLNLKNIKLNNKDGFESKEEDADLFFIDIPNAEEIVELAYSSLKEGGYIGAHCLSIEQGKRLVLECKKKFSEVHMIENIVREYEVDEIRTRPKHIGIMHTSYLVFARK